MKGDTPKLIKKMIDDVEAAQADVRSGNPTLMLHGFATLIGIVTEQTAMLTENYPEDRRLREFLENQIREMKASHDLVAERVEQEAVREKQRQQWRADHALRETARKLREKEERAAERQRAKERAAIATEEQRIQQAKRAEEAARQGKLFDE